MGTKRKLPSDPEGRPDVEVPPRGSGRLSQTDKLLEENAALDAEVLRLTEQVEALTAELKVAKGTLAQIEWEHKPGGELGKGDVGNVVHCARKNTPGPRRSKSRQICATTSDKTCNMTIDELTRLVEATPGGAEVLKTLDL